MRHFLWMAAYRGPAGSSASSTGMHRARASRQTSRIESDFQAQGAAFVAIVSNGWFWRCYGCWRVRLSRRSVRRWNCLVTSLVEIACSACRTKVHSVRAIIDCTIQIPIPCRGRLPRLPARCDDRNARRMANRNAKGINRIRWTESVWFPCAGGHGGPPLRRGFVVEQAFQISSEVL